MNFSYDALVTAGSGNGKSGGAIRKQREYALEARGML